MAYTDTPLANQDLDVSQPLIRDNFNTADTIFGKNHYSFKNLTALVGKHKFVSLPVLANYAAISPAPVAGDQTLYSKTVSAVSQLFCAADATGNEYQLTRIIPASFGVFSTKTVYPQAPAKAYESGGWTFLPGGMILQYGVSNPIPDTKQGITKFPIAFTNPAFCVSITGICSSGNSSARPISLVDGTVTTTQFTWEFTAKPNSAMVGFTWIAIGK